MRVIVVLEHILRIGKRDERGEVEGGRASLPAPLRPGVGEGGLLLLPQSVGIALGGGGDGLQWTDALTHYYYYYGPLLLLLLLP